MLDDETLSDHNCIMIEVIDKENMRETPRSQVGWFFSKPRKGAVGDLIQTAMDARPITPDNIVKATRDACHILLRPKFTGGRQRKEHWWTEEVDRRRKACIRARRHLARRKRTTGRTCPLLAANYQLTRAEFRAEIVTTKRAAWEKLREDKSRPMGRH